MSMISFNNNNYQEHRQDHTPLAINKEVKVKEILLITCV